MAFTVRHATVSFQTDGETWREQKERRAALMVGILIGVFVLCWIPFFLAELIIPLCSCDIPPVWKSVFLWLGYSNSFFNPLIYTAFNKNYNNAFRNLFSRQRWGMEIGENGVKSFNGLNVNRSLCSDNARPWGWRPTASKHQGTAGFRHRLVRKSVLMSTCFESRSPSVKQWCWGNASVLAKAKHQTVCSPSSFRKKP